MVETEPHVFAKRSNQAWCLCWSNGRRYIGIHNPFTDPYLKEYLNKILGEDTASLLEFNLTDMGIVKGVPQLLDADKNSFIIIPTVTMYKIGRVLEDLVEVYCQDDADVTEPS